MVAHKGDPLPCGPTSYRCAICSTQPQNGYLLTDGGEGAAGGVGMVLPVTGGGDGTDGGDGGDGGVGIPRTLPRVRCSTA